MPRAKQSKGETGKRTKKVLEGDDLMQIAVRVPVEIAARADALIGWVQNSPAVRALGRKVSRSTVFRMAVGEGLEVLEARAAVGEAKPAKRRRVVASRPPPEGVDPYERT